MIDIQVFRDEGAVVNGRGTPIEVMNFNMKNSASYVVEYYPTNETDSAPLIRPIVDGDQTLSYKVYTFFKLNGSYDAIKNVRFRVTVEAPQQATDAQLFYKLTNQYAVPDNAFDGDMMLLANKDGTVLSDPIYPNLSTVGPNLATSRQTAYFNVSPLYTPYLVTQIRVNKGSLVGNTAEMRLKFECYEYPAGA